MALTKINYSQIKGAPVNVLDYGASPSASAATNDTAFATANTYAASNGLGLTIPAGTYNLSTTWTISTNGMRVQAVGKVILSFTNSGNCVSIDGGAASSIYDVNFGEVNNKIHISGNASTTNALYIRSAHHSTICINGKNCITALRQEYGVCNKLYVTSSVNEGAFTLTPTTGIYLDQRGAGEYSATCEIYPVLEGMSGTGIAGIYASFCTIFGGTSEGNAKGITYSANCRLNTVIGTDLESNSVSNIEDAGVSNTFVNLSAIQATQILLNGSGATFIGGLIRSVVMGAGSYDTTFDGTGFTSTVGISGTGPYKRIGCYTVDTNSNRNGSLSDIVGESSQTWTPSFLSAGGGAQGAVTNAVGNYCRVGKMCFVQGFISIAKGTLGVGGVSITGLPFQGRNTTNDYQYITMSEWDNITLGAGYTGITLRIPPNSNTGTLLKTGTAVASATVNVADFPDPMGIRFSGVYETI